MEWVRGPQESRRYIGCTKTSAESHFKEIFSLNIFIKSQGEYHRSITVFMLLKSRFPHFFFFFGLYYNCILLWTICGNTILKSRSPMGVQPSGEGIFGCCSHNANELSTLVSGKVKNVNKRTLLLLLLHNTL